MRVTIPVNGVYNKRIKCPGPTGEFKIITTVPVTAYRCRVATDSPVRQEGIPISNYSQGDLSYTIRPTAIVSNLNS